MPSFFDFQTGSEARRLSDSSSPLLGRFRAVPTAHQRRSRGRGTLFGGYYGYESVFGHEDDSPSEDDDDDDDDDDEDDGLLRRCGHKLRDLWLEPKQAAVARAVRWWWSRWVVLAVLPAALVSG
jgi:hypothetical protein